MFATISQLTTILTKLSLSGRLKSYLLKTRGTMAEQKDFQPIFSREETAEQEQIAGAYELVTPRVNDMLSKIMADTSLPEEWKKAIQEHQPLLQAVLELSQVPDVQWRASNLLTTVHNKQVEAQKPAITITEDEATQGPPTTPPVDSWKPIV
jgi:hypothetical protein